MSDSMQHPLRDTDRTESGTQRRWELFLVGVVLLITGVGLLIPQHKSLILYLYFLPVSYSAFHLGRYRAGSIALLCVLGKVCIEAWGQETIDPQLISIVDWLSFLVWSAILGLTAILTGTLSDERAAQMRELSETHRTDTLVDALTEVANRRAFEFELSRRMSEFQRQGTPFGLIFVDIDRFKKFNDTYGHRAGDAVLRGVALTLEESVREVDLVARYGGEEIAIILPNSTNCEVKEVAERARTMIEASRFNYGDLRLRVTVSVGVAEILADEQSVDLVERTDAALYASKQAGRNCSHIHLGEGCELFGAAIPSRPSYDDREMVVEATGGNAFCDQVTGLPSRKVFIEELRRRVAESKRYSIPLSIALIEIDAFDEIWQADPEAGRKVLAVSGEFIRDIMRDSDLVARHSFNQFGVLMPATCASDAAIPAERLRIRIAECQSVLHEGMPLSFSVSAGITEVLPGDVASVTLERCYVATQTAKRASGNVVCLHDGVTCELVNSREPASTDIAR